MANQTKPPAGGPVSQGVGTLLVEAAQRWPQRRALIDSGKNNTSITYRALHEAARSASAHLAQKGIRPGERVALVGENSIDFVTSWFAILYAGATVVPLPILSAPREIEFRINHSACRTLIFDAPRSELARGGRHRRPTLPMAELVEARPLTDHTLPTVDPEDTAMILYTSGTTGHPKGARISHRTLGAHAAGIGEHALRLTEHDRVLGVLPLTHSYGLRMVVLASLFAGCPAILVPRFDAAASLELARQENVSWIPAVPTMFSAWGALDTVAPLPALRWCLSAGSPLPDEILRRAEDRLGATIRQGYGMTEATFSTINAPPDKRVLGSVGRPASGVEIRITADDDTELSPGSIGEVTRETMGNGWLHTGDLGRVDESGRLHIIDRLKDMIIRGGNNVYPSELEAILCEHPDILEVAVVGKPDAHYGEEIVALLVARPGRDPDRQELHAWAKERIARNKLPRFWAFLETMPLGPSRKILKRELRERIADGRLRPEVI